MAELSRVVEPPRSRALLKWSLRLAAIAATGFGVKALATRAEPAQTPAALASPISPILVPLAAPQLVVVPAPAPLAPPPPEEPVVPEARATSPVVRAECVTVTTPADELPHCAWDTGFPAISADGTTIATEFIPIDDGRGNPGLTIRLVDVATGKAVKSVLVLSPDEYVDKQDPKRPALDKKIARRADQAQALLAGYRAMIELGAQDADAIAPEATAGMRAQFEDDTVRLIDTAKNRAVWQRRFDVAREFPGRKLDGEQCEPVYTHGISAAWDPPTRIVLASVNYLTAPEFCGNDVQRDYIGRVTP